MIYFIINLTLYLLRREAELVGILPLSPSLCGDTPDGTRFRRKLHLPKKRDGTIFSISAFLSFSLDPPSNERAHRAVPYVLCLGMAVCVSLSLIINRLHT